MDLLQSLSGLALGVFMWGHMLFVASILLGKDAMWTVTRFFEGYFFFGTSHPGIVSVVVAAVVLLFVTHAALALRKFPVTTRQYGSFLAHKAHMRHGDTSLWWWQVVTGFALFFLASPHLFQMLAHPGAIGPYASADRVWTGGWWPLYLVLLLAVEVHAGIGLYRLAIKWGWFCGPDADAARRRLQRAKRGATAVLLVLGLATLAVYAKIGYDHRDRVGERYAPAWAAQGTERSQ
jgi:fumarate reductase subunit C